MPRLVRIVQRAPRRRWSRSAPGSPAVGQTPVRGRADPAVRCSRGRRRMTTSRAVRYRSAPAAPRMHPLLLLLADPVGRHGRTGEQRPGTLARISQDRLGQPRHRPAPVDQRRTDGVHHSLTRYPGAGIEAQQPSRRPNVVQPFDGSVLSDPALPSGPRGRQLGIGGGKSLSSFPQPRQVDPSAANRRSVKHEQLGTEAFNPMPSLRAGVAELATAVRAGRKRNGGDNDEEHHRDQHDRSQQDGGHRTDSTPATSLMARSLARGGRRDSPPPGPDRGAFGARLTVWRSGLGPRHM